MGVLFGRRRIGWADWFKRPILPILTFFIHWLRNPSAIGSVVPSGPALGRALARHVPVQCRGPVVELGGGTGSVTAELLRNGVAARDLIVIEREPDLCALIRSRFPAVTVVADDVRNIAQILEAIGVEEPSAIVSSLPLLSLGRGTSREIMSEVFRTLRHDGVYLQYTYGPSSPVPAAAVAAEGVDGRRMEWVFANFPPAAVWRYVKTGQFELGPEAASGS